MKTETKRSPADLKQILDEDQPNISKRFKLRISYITQKDFVNKRHKDLLQKINAYLLKIFERKS